MKFLIFIVLAFKIQITYSQNNFEIRNDTINKTDKNGLKQGVWNEYWENGQLWVQQNFKYDKKNGEYLYYDKNGELKEIGFFDNDKEIGYTFEFRNNKIWRSKCYVDTNSSPIINDYFDNQLPVTGGNYSNGKGQKVEYFDNGNVKKISTYIKHYEDGIYTEFYLNGQLKESGIIKSSFPFTIFCSFDSLGNSIDFGKLINGTGILKRYYCNGTLKKVEEYKSGKYWTTLKYYSFDGKNLDCGNIKDGQGIMLEYYDNGNLKTSSTFINGFPNGNYIEYYENGIHKVSGQLINGIRDGIWILYNNDGKIYYKILYDNGDVNQ